VVEYVEKLAEAAVKDAIESLAASGKRAYSGSVPGEAVRLLLQKGRSRITRAVAEAKVKIAIERLRDRKEIKAPPARNNDWAVMNRKPPPTASPAG
jgi:hypothetical protein